MTDQQPDPLKLADRTNACHGPHAQALAAAVRRLQADLEANAAAFDREREERIKAQGEAATLAAMLDRLQAGGQGVEPQPYAVQCDACGGDGFDRKDNNYKCADCGGTGFVSRLLYAHPPAVPALAPPDPYDADFTAGRLSRSNRAPALVPLSPAQYNQIPELCVIKPSLYERIVRAIERAHGINGINGINGLTVGGDAKP